MKINDTLAELCVFWSKCHPDIVDLASSCTSRQPAEEFMAKYRSVLMNAAVSPMTGISGVEYLTIPGRSSHFSFETARLRNTVAFSEGHRSKPYAALDNLVKVQGLPILSDMRIAAPHNARYFRNIDCKRAVMQDLFGENFGWILLLPLDYVSENSGNLQKFKREGGRTSILPFTSVEMQRAVQAYSSAGQNYQVQD